MVRRGGALGVMLGGQAGVGVGWGDGLPGFQDAVLGSDGAEDFCQRRGLGCGKEERRGNWSYAGVRDGLASF